MPDVILYSFTIAICFFAGILAIGYLPLNKRGNFWFGTFLFSLAFALLSRVIALKGFEHEYPQIIPIAELSRFIIAPSFYFGVWCYTRNTAVSQKTKVLHLLPALLFLSTISVPYFLQIGDITDAFSPQTNNIIGFVMRIAVPMQLVIYWVLSLTLLLRHRNTLRLLSTRQGDLSWLSGILLSQLLIISIWITCKLINNDTIDFTVPYLCLFLVLFMVCHLLKQKEVFLKIEERYEPGYDNYVVRPRLTDDQLEEYKCSLDQLLEKQEIFTDPDMSLSLLSKKIGVTVNDLSYLINVRYHVNFYTLINTYRIQKVKLLLSDDRYKHLTILGIAYEAGFTSKSTFNAAFKKHSGFTPSDYLKCINTEKMSTCTLPDDLTQI